MIEEAILQTCANLQEKENRKNDCGRNVSLGAGMLFWRQECYFSGRNVILGAGMLLWGQEYYLGGRNVFFGGGGNVVLGLTVAEIR